MSSEDHSSGSSNSSEYSEIFHDDSKKQKSSYPRFRLLRGEDMLVETIQFTPSSIITILIHDTGESKMTSLTMMDNFGQIRYKSSSGGKYHEYMTRLQDSRAFGRWLIIIDGILANEKTNFTLEIPFFLVRQIDKELKEPVYNTEEIVKKYQDHGQESNNHGEPILHKSTEENDTRSSSLLDQVIQDEIRDESKIKPALYLRSSNKSDLSHRITEGGSKSQMTETRDDRIGSESSNNKDNKESKSNDKQAETEKPPFNISKKGELEVEIPEEFLNRPSKEELDEFVEENKDTIQSQQPKVEKSDLDNEIPTKSGKNTDNLSDETKRLVEKISTPELTDKLMTQISREHIEGIFKKVGTTKIEKIKELFIPLDEIDQLSVEQLNMLNQHGIYYIEEFLVEPPEVLMDIIICDFDFIQRVYQIITEMIMEDNHPIYEKYSKIGEIEDNTLYYSTIDVTEINGIGPNTFDKLDRVGLGKVTDLANAQIKNVAKITGFSVRKVAEFITEAKSLVYKRVNIIDHDFSEAYEDLDQITETSQLDLIKGIELNQLNELYGLSINNLGKLADRDIVKLAQLLDLAIPKIAGWIFEAQVYIYGRVSIQFRAPSI